MWSYLHVYVLCGGGQSKYSDAKPLYERALTVFEDNFGFNHPIVAEIIHNLAVLSYQQVCGILSCRLYLATNRFVTSCHMGCT